MSRKAPRQEKKSMLAKGLAGKSLAEYEVIDFHGHLGWWFFAIPDDSPEGLVAKMDRVGVKSIFVSSLECMSGRTQAGNDEVLEAMTRFPGRFLGYAVAWPESAEAVKAEIETRLDQGFSGIKLHNANGFEDSHPNYASAWGIADERRLPILLHTYGERKVLAEIAGLAKLYRGANIVLAHSGVANIGEYIRIANDHENIYLELCGSMCVYGVVEKLAGSVPVEKLLWGSDMLFIDMPQQVGKVLGADIPESAKKKILSGNAKRLLAKIRR